MRQPGVLICTPLVASMFGQVGERAQRFFAAVAHRGRRLSDGRSGLTAPPWWPAFVPVAAASLRPAAGWPSERRRCGAFMLLEVVSPLVLDPRKWSLAFWCYRS